MSTTTPTLRTSLNYLFLLALLLTGAFSMAQTINGPANVSAGATASYSFDSGITYLFGAWAATGGTVASSSSSGTTYTCTIQWGAAGTGTVTFKNKSTTVSSLSIAICSPPGAPSSAFTYASKCFQHVTGEVTVITRTASPPSGQTWYWQTTPSGTATANGTPSVNAGAGQVYYLRALSSGGCWGVNTLATATIPFPPSVSDASGCAGSSLTVSAGGGTVRWYDACSGGNLLSTSSSYTTPPLTATAYYYVAQYNAGVESPRKRATAAILTTPADMAPIASPAALCSPGGTATLTATAEGTNDLVQWFTEPTGGIAFSTANPVDVAVGATTTYYVSGKNIYSGCEGPRTAVTVSVNPPPAAATMGPLQCTATGSYKAGEPGAGANSLRWYDAPTGGNLVATGLQSPTVTEGHAYYYAASYHTDTGCETTVRTVALVEAVAPPIASDATVCGGATIPATPGFGGIRVRWYDAPADGNLLASGTTSPKTNASTTYYLTTYDPSRNCESPMPRTPVTLTVVPLPIISGNAPIVFTYGSSNTASVTLSTTDYYSYQWKKDGEPLGNAPTYSTDLIGSYTVSTKTSADSPECTSLPVVVGNTLTGQPTPINYVSSTRIYKEGVAPGTSLYALAQKDLAQTIAYQDGLGRTFQTVALGQSAAQTDMVSPVAYGRQGLVDSTFLPYATTGRDGRLRLNAIRGGTNFQYSLSEQKAFYQNTPLVATDASPYARSVHKPSLDGRVTEQGAPGAAWQPGTTRTVRSTLALNGTTYPVRYWKPDGTTTGNYPANTVAVAIATDENGNQVRTYTNQQGQTVLKQVQLGETINGTLVNWLDTYYIYDAYGRLAYQVPPKATALITTAAYNVAANAATDNLVYKYAYDSLGRVVEKWEPGAAVKYMVYDRLGRLALTQDGNLRAANQWAYTKYDQYHRPVYSGIYTNTQKISRKAVQGLFIALDYTTQPYYEAPATNAAYRGYTNQAFPTANITVLAARYYDGYDFDQNGTADFAYQPAHITANATSGTTLPAMASAAVRNLATGSGRLVLGTTTWLRSAVFYDRYDRVLQTQGHNHLNTATPSVGSVVYADRAGHVEKTKQTHYGPAGASVAVQQRYAYDATWRTTAIYHSTNGAAEKQVAAYAYNVLGQLVDKKLHVVNGTPLQSVDYRYTIRGWLSSINNAQLNVNNATNDDANDLFGMELLYNTAESGLGNTLYYNGNVSAAKWKGPGTAAGAADQRSYKYAYDKSDKLKAATFAAHTGTAWTKEANTLNETMAYEHNGNITALVRHQNNRGLSGATVTSAPQAMDNLAYTYTANTNQLLKVEDAGTAGGFSNGADVATEYAYNTDGSLTADQNKGISAISYNLLGKPQQITYASGTKVVYTYDAAGAKLKTATTVGTVTTTTDYVGGFVYTNNALSFFSSPEGRVVKNGANFEYQYAIADHQGNTRVVFSAAAPNNTPINATFEGGASDGAGTFTNVDPGKVVPGGSAAYSGTKVVRLDPTYKVGPTRSVHVYPGDKVGMEVWEYHEAASGYGTSASALGALVTTVAANIGGASGAPGEAGMKYNGVNSAFLAFGTGGNQGDARPAAYLNFILFDRDYKVLDAGWQLAPEATFTKQKLSFQTKNISVEGYLVAWLSYDDDNNWVYFDDFKITHTKTNVVQYNEYYPFGLTTANSWTRENNVGNNFLGNGGTELNSTTALYDLHYRNYDPVLGRMNQVDPLASKYAATTPYNFAFNDPANYNDPLGDDPGSSAHCSWCYTKPRPIDTGNGSGGGSGEGGGNPFAGLMGRSAGFFDPGWQPGSGSLSAGAFASMDARYNAYNIARGNVNALRSGTYTNDGNGGFIYSPVVTGSANVPIAQVSFVLGQNGHYMGYKLLIGPKLKILYVDRDISVVQGKDGGWESVGTTTMFDLEDNTSFSYGSAVALAQGNMAYTSSGTENSGWGFEFYNGIPIVTSPWVERGAAFTPGPFIIKHPSINPHTDRRDQQLIRHEIGHVINFLMTPALYIPVIAIPSVINFQTGLGGDHDSFYTEKIANTLSEWFFGPFDNPNKYPSYNKK